MDSTQALRSAAGEQARPHAALPAGPARGRVESGPAAASCSLAFPTGTRVEKQEAPGAGSGRSGRSGWRGRAGRPRGWTASFSPSAWAAARTPLCTRPTPRWVRGGAGVGARELGRPDPERAQAGARPGN